MSSVVASKKIQAVAGDVALKEPTRCLEAWMRTAPCWTCLRRCWTLRRGDAVQGAWNGEGGRGGTGTRARVYPSGAPLPLLCCPIAVCTVEPVGSS